MNKKTTKKLLLLLPAALILTIYMVGALNGGKISASSDKVTATAETAAGSLIGSSSPASSAAEETDRISSADTGSGTSSDTEDTSSATGTTGTGTASKTGSTGTAGSLATAVPSGSRYASDSSMPGSAYYGITTAGQGDSFTDSGTTGTGGSTGTSSGTGSTSTDNTGNSGASTGNTGTTGSGTDNTPTGGDSSGNAGGTTGGTGTNPVSNTPEKTSQAYLEYDAMSSEERTSFVNSFSSAADFVSWYNDSRSAYLQQRDSERTTGGEIDLS